MFVFEHRGNYKRHGAYMRLIIHRNYEELSSWIAGHIAGRIKAAGKDKPFVMGLPTGSSPMGTYRELVAMYKQGTLSFANVITFNMDEYVGLSKDHPQSYHRFMWDNFFSHIDIDRNNVHLLDGMTEDPVKECAAYEAAIAAAGGIDLFLGGVGTDGHIAFNEPGSSLASRTRVKNLAIDTRMDNARFFDNDLSRVPAKALTVGVGTVMAAREVLFIVSGRNKARALQRAVEGGVNHMCALSSIQMHQRAIIVCDEAATDELKVGTVRYFKQAHQKAAKL